MGDHREPSIVAIPTKEGSATPWDTIFRCACLYFGIQTSPVKRRGLNYCILSCWIATLLYAAYLVPFGSYELFTQEREPISLCKAIIYGYHSILATTSFYTVFWVSFNTKDLAPILRGNGRGLRDVFIPVTVAIAEMAWPFYGLLTRPSETFPRLPINIATKLTPAAFFLVYTDLVAGVLNDQREILESSALLDVDCNALSAKKWKVRERIRVTNSAFAQILLMSYLQSFVTVIVLLGSTIAVGLPMSALISFLLLLISVLVQMFSLAKQCSGFYMMCLETDQRLLREVWSTEICSACHSELRAVLRFHDDWDTFKLGCFCHSLQNFVKFLGTGLTCVAIALQFDFGVIRALTTLSNQPSI